MQRVVDALERYPAGETLRYLADAAGMRFNAFVDIIRDLEKEGKLESCEIDKPCGQGIRTVSAVRLKTAHR
jgi:hypothetical protein